MSQYNNLKGVIASQVYTNHNNEVTAEMVKTAMNAMTDSLGAGYQYLGIATPNTTPPESPDQNVFYIAAEPGTYTNFPISGGYLQVTENEVAIFKYNGTWSKETTGIKLVSVSQNTLIIGDTEVGRILTDDDNPEWMEITIDADGNILEGIRKDGTKYIAKLPSDVPFNPIIVDASGNGDYYTLTDAVDSANDGDTIIVLPGVYDNELVRGSEKNLFIIGLDREKCIIKNHAGTRANSVIEFGGGCIKNLSIISEAQDGDAYCIHMDYHLMKNNTIDIENCNLINMSADYSNGCIGVGLRGGCVLTLKNCLLSAPSATHGNALYSHDNDYNDPQYNGEQRLKVVDCIINAPGANAVTIQGQGTPSRDFSVSQYYIEFVRNRIVGGCSFINYYNDPGTITSDDFEGVKNLRLSPISWGNSASVLNAE